MTSQAYKKQQVVAKQSEEQVKIHEVLLEVNLQDEPKVEEIRREPTLAKYVRRHHAPDQVIGDKDSGVMKRKILRSDTCLLCEFDPKLMKDALNNEHLIQGMCWCK